MFLGTFEHSLDPKGRVILPAKFRDQLASGAFLSKVLDGCLALYTAEEFEKVALDMQEKARRGSIERNFVRSFAAGTTEATPDRQGRITIPPKLREFAGLERDVVVNGAIQRIEIWDAARWRQLDEEADQSMVEARPDVADIGI